MWMEAMQDKVAVSEVADASGPGIGQPAATRAARVCPRLTASGRPCGWPPMRGSDLCWNHATDPGVPRQIKRIVAAVEAGTMSRRRGDVLVKALRAAVRAQKTLDKLKAKQPVRIAVKLPPWAAQDKVENGRD